MTMILSPTSYETDWATARTAPIIEYLLFLLQPAPRIEYTPTDEIPMNHRAENLNEMDSYMVGKTAQSNIGMSRERQGTAI